MPLGASSAFPHSRYMATCVSTRTLVLTAMLLPPQVLAAEAEALQLHASTAKHGHLWFHSHIRPDGHCLPLQVQTAEAEAVQLRTRIAVAERTVAELKTRVDAAEQSAADGAARAAAAEQTAAQHKARADTAEQAAAQQTARADDVAAENERMFADGCRLSQALAHFRSRAGAAKAENTALRGENAALLAALQWRHGGSRVSADPGFPTDGCLAAARHPASDETPPATEGACFSPFEPAAPAALAAAPAGAADSAAFHSAASGPAADRLAPAVRRSSAIQPAAIATAAADPAAFADVHTSAIQSAAAGGAPATSAATVSNAGWHLEVNSAPQVCLPSCTARTAWDLLHFEAAAPASCD